MSLQEPPGRNAADFGRRIRQRRERQGLTLAQLADKSGLSAGYLSLLERGQKIPSPEAAADLARGLGDDEALYRSWAAALRAGISTSDVIAIQTSRPPSDFTMMGAEEWSPLAALTAETTPDFEQSDERIWPSSSAEADVVAVRVLPTHADPIDPKQMHGGRPLYLDRRFIGAEPGDRLFAYEMTSEAAALLDDVAAPGDHIVFSTRVTRITPSRVYAVRTGSRVVAARLGLVGESAVIVPSGGERDVEMVNGDWRGAVRGVAVVVIRRLLSSRPSSERPSRLPMSDMDDRELVVRLRRGDPDAVHEIRRRYFRVVEGAIVQSTLPEDHQRKIGGNLREKLREDDWWMVRRWTASGSFLPYLARLVRWAFNDYARTALGHKPGKDDLAGEDRLERLPPGALGPLEILRDRERMKAIESVVGLLNPRDQDLVYRRYVFEERPSDIADVLRMSPSAVHVALHRARARFEKLAMGKDSEILRPLIERMSTTV